MIAGFERLSDSARQAMFWSWLAAHKAGDSQIRPVHLLAGIHQAMPKLFRPLNLRRAGLALPRMSFGDLHEMVTASVSPGAPRPPSPGTNAFEFDSPKLRSGSLKRALKLAEGCARELGAETVGTVHLLWGIYHADANLRQKLRRAKLTEPNLEALCRNYQPSREGQSTAQLLEKRRPHPSRSGIGYDLHRLAEGRKLIVGGVELPFDKGPVGHSDGDVLAHAICDALLGAASLGDIGTHFPDTDPKWKGVSSVLFLELVRKLLDEKNLEISHIDATVIAEKPKLGPHFPSMRAALAKALGIEPDQINLKAKTNEGLDAIGRGEAIAAHAIATLEG